MALYAASITKETRWHGQLEEYDNTYYYDGPNFQAGDENYKRVLDALVAAERLVHGPTVTFKKGRMWTAGGTPVQNETIALLDYSGAGTATISQRLFAEAAVLVEWECARTNILGRKVYLRKYLRPGYLPTGGSIEQAVGADMLVAAVKAPFKTYADTVQQIEPIAGAVPWVLTSPTDRKPRNPANGVVNDYLISREFRRN